MITLDKRIESLALYMERTERVMFLISVGAPSWTVMHNIGLVGESATELKDSLKVGDGKVLRSKGG